MAEEVEQNSQDIIDDRVTDSDINVNVDTGLATFRINSVGKIQGTYLGVFQFNCTLTPIAYLEADRDYRELLGKNAEFAATTADNVAWNLAQLRQRVVTAPPFWNEFNERFGGSRVKDFDIVSLVMTAATIAEKKYRKLLTERHERSIAKLVKHVEKMKQADETLVAAEQDKLDQEST